MSTRYAIAEWFGRPFEHLSVAERQSLARCALKLNPTPPCPFQRSLPTCSKRGGVFCLKAIEVETVVLV